MALMLEHKALTIETLSSKVIFLNCVNVFADEIILEIIVCRKEVNRAIGLFYQLTSRKKGISRIKNM